MQVGRACAYVNGFTKHVHVSTVNAQRVHTGLAPLTIIIVPLLVCQGGKLSSTSIRQRLHDDL